jgi:hypothetical protein
MACWFEETNSVAMVARRYRAEFGVEPPSLAQIRKIHQKFLETGSVLGGSAAASGQSAASAIEASLMHKNHRLASHRLASDEAAQLAMQAMKGPIERFA